MFFFLGDYCTKFSQFITALTENVGLSKIIYITESVGMSFMKG